VVDEEPAGGHLLGQPHAGPDLDHTCCRAAPPKRRKIAHALSAASPPEAKRIFAVYFAVSLRFRWVGAAPGPYQFCANGAARSAPECPPSSGSSGRPGPCSCRPPGTHASIEPPGRNRLATASRWTMPPWASQGQQDFWGQAEAGKPAVAIPMARASPPSIRASTAGHATETERAELRKIVGQQGEQMLSRQLKPAGGFQVARLGGNRSWSSATHHSSLAASQRPQARLGQPALRSP